MYGSIVKDHVDSQAIKCIAELNTGWFNVSFNSEQACESLISQGIRLDGVVIMCERASLHNSVVTYVKAPYEMSDQTVMTAIIGLWYRSQYQKTASQL